MHRYIQDEQIVVQGAVKLQIIHNIHALNVTWLLTLGVRLVVMSLDLDL